MAPKVKYTKVGEVHTFEIGLPGFEKIVIDHTNVPADQRGGVAKQLLAAAALSCYSSALAGSLDARGAKYEKITGEATLGMGPNAVGQGRVKKINLEFNVDLPEEDDDIFQRVVKIMKQGCLVTGSLHDGIEMSYDLKPSYAAEKE
ncbi:MAG: OsmC family protein [Mailhella sp.]|nr:OsmC family protein [Mailhella sp.]